MIVVIKEECYEGALVFVDLRGSEDHGANMGDASKEYTEINLDRSALQHVLENLHKPDYKCRETRSIGIDLNELLRPDIGKLRLAYLCHLILDRGTLSSRVLCLMPKLDKIPVGNTTAGGTRLVKAGEEESSRE